MNDEQRLEEFLRESAVGALREDAGDNHLDVVAIARSVERGGFGPREVEHLARCLECRTSVAGAAHETTTSSAGESWWGRVRGLLAGIGPVPALAAAALLAVAVVTVVPDADDRSPVARGGSDVDLDAPEVTILIDLDGVRHELIPGEKIPMNARLAFRYANRAGHAKTVSILAWDRNSVHWYYPEKAGQPAHALRSGPKVTAERLPFDIVFDGQHRPGPLTIAVAFDASPADVADALRGKTDVDGLQTFVVQLVGDQ